MGSITPLQRTLLRITDDIAVSDPDRLYCVQSISLDVSQGWKDITFSGLVAAANRMAQWIEQNVAPSGTSETLAYVAINDVRYVAFVLACMRLRHTVSDYYPQYNLKRLL
jgi:acyl-CoA synthetase (AMP-forming)/AMP-acid ligase II